MTRAYLTTDLAFRPATAADAGVAGSLIYSSGPAAFDYVFAQRTRSAQAFLRAAFMDGAGEFGWRNHALAVIDGQVVAAGAGFGSESALAFTLAAARQVVGYYGLRSVGPILRGLRTERVIRPPGRDEWYLAHLGVVAALRGEGIGRQLVEQLLDQGRAAGKQMATLDVAVTNPRAQALYARMGFKVAAQRASALRNARGRVPGSIRMALPLTPS